MASHIGIILRKDKNRPVPRHKTDVTGKLRTKIRHLEHENRLKVNDMQYF